MILKSLGQADTLRQQAFWYRLKCNFTLQETYLQSLAALIKRLNKRIDVRKVSALSDRLQPLSA